MKGDEKLLDGAHKAMVGGNAIEYRQTATKPMSFAEQLEAAPLAGLAENEDMGLKSIRLNGVDMDLSQTS